MSDQINVKGIAIKAGVSRNGVMYTAEELAKFAKTMEGVSIQKDHDNSVDSAIGKVTKAMYHPETQEILFEGWVKEDGTGILEKIKDKRVQHVSIGAMVGKMVKDAEDSDYMTAIDMMCVELSTVIVPGVPVASIQQTLSVNTSVNEKMDEKTNSVSTSLDIQDKHTHVANYDELTGKGFTTLSEGGNWQPHFHKIENWEVVDNVMSEYTSKHPGKLKGYEQYGMDEKIEAEITEKDWDVKYINDLPDSAFALILPGGDKDDDGKTVPRTLRMLPHHGMNVKTGMEHDTVDMSHLRNAMARLSQTDTSDMMKAKAKKHLDMHAMHFGMGEKEEQLQDRKMEENTMEQEKNNAELLEKLQSQEVELAKLQEQLKKAVEEKKAKLVSEYKNLIQEKQLEEKNVSTLSEEALTLFVEQLKNVKVGEKKMEQPKMKGEIGSSKVTEETENNNLVVEKSEFGRGMSIFSESYQDSKYSRFKR